MDHLIWPQMFCLARLSRPATELVNFTRLEHNSINILVKSENV